MIICPFSRLPRWLGRPPTWLVRTILIACLFPLGAFGQMQLPSRLPPPGTLKKMTVEELMDVQVTSVSKRPEKLFEAASAIQVITGEDVRRAGATSLPEALRLASNLEVAQIDARQWALTARGFNNVFAAKMLVLIDGRSVYTPLYAGVYWDVQDTMLADLDRIEVISGPGATQWGSNAVNGVINVTTKSARETQGLYTSAGLGSELRATGETRYGGKLSPNLFYRVYAKYFDRGTSYRRNGRPSNDASRHSQLGFRTDWDASQGTVLTLQGDAYAGVIDQSGPENTKVDGQNMVGRWTHQLAEDSELTVQVYYDRTHRRIPASFTQTLDTYDIDVQHRRAIGRVHDLVWGVGYRIVADDIINTPTNAFLPPKVSRPSFNAFIQDEVMVVPERWRLTVGTKLEHNDYTGVELEPSVRGAWTPDDRQTVWAAISRAIRTPSRIDRDLYSPAVPPFRIAGGQRVVSEKLIAYELGYRWRFESSLAVSLATFVNDYHDLRSLEPLNPPQPFPVEATSGLRGRSDGAELMLEWQATPVWRLDTGWTELRVHSEPQGEGLARGTRDSIARDPNHQLMLRSLWSLGAKWELDMHLRYVGMIPMSSVPGYTEGDLRLGWRPTAAWEYSVLGQNLLHGHHAEFNAPGARREVQRSIYAKASWQF